MWQSHVTSALVLVSNSFIPKSIVTNDKRKHVQYRMVKNVVDFISAFVVLVRCEEPRCVKLPRAKLPKQPGSSKDETQKARPFVDTCNFIIDAFSRYVLLSPTSPIAPANMVRTSLLSKYLRYHQQSRIVKDIREMKSKTITYINDEFREQGKHVRFTTTSSSDTVCVQNCFNIGRHLRTSYSLIEI